MLVVEEQNGSQVKHSCTDTTFTIKQLIKKRVFNLETHLAFINYEKVFDI